MIFSNQIDIRSDAELSEVVSVSTAMIAMGHNADKYTTMKHDAINTISSRAIAQEARELGL